MCVPLLCVIAKLVNQTRNQIPVVVLAISHGSDLRSFPSLMEARRSLCARRNSTKEHFSSLQLSYALHV